MPTPPQQQQPPPGTRPHAPGRPPAGPGNGRAEPDCPCPPGGARPLPDPAALRLLRVPDSAPPYDAPGSGDEGAVGRCQGEDGAASPPNGRAAGGQWAAGETREERAAAAAPGSLVPASCADPDGGTGRSGHPGPDGGTGPGDGADPDGSTGRSGHPGPDGGTGPGDGADPGRWPGQFAQALAETLAGSRPPRQIVPWTTERARTHIRRLGAQLSLGQQPRVRRVVTCRPRQDVVEMTVIVDCRPRVRALAVRLEHVEAAGEIPGRPARSARWLCTAVEAA